MEEAEGWFLKAKEIDSTDTSVYQHYGKYLFHKLNVSQLGITLRLILKKTKTNIQVQGQFLTDLHDDFVQEDLFALQTTHTKQWNHQNIV